MQIDLPRTEGGSYRDLLPRLPGRISRPAYAEEWLGAVPARRDRAGRNCELRHGDVPATRRTVWRNVSLQVRTMKAPATAADGDYEHVFLISDDLEEVELRSVDAELQQAAGDSCHRFTIFNGEYLRILRRTAAQVSRDYWINLAFLDPQPVRSWSPVWSAASGISAVAALAAIGLHREPVALSADPYSSVAASLAVIASLSCLGIAVRKSFGEFRFLSIHGRAPIFQISSNRPDCHEVRAFLLHLRGAAEKARAGQWQTKGDYLRDEMKEHRRLQNAGVLSEEQFQAARGLILRAHG